MRIVPDDYEEKQAKKDRREEYIRKEGRGRERIDRVCLGTKCGGRNFKAEHKTQRMCPLCRKDS
jgi:hypothetical protein